MNTEGQNMRWPTTLILCFVIGSVTVLGWQGTVDGQAVTTIYSTVVSGVLVGHYVKTSNGSKSETPAPSDRREGESL
jgi:hypothetical protein